MYPDNGEGKRLLAETVHSIRDAEVKKLLAETEELAPLACCSSEPNSSPAFCCTLPAADLMLPAALSFCTCAIDEEDRISTHHNTC